jgi:hypothetical protein
MKLVCGPPTLGVTHTRLGVEGSRSAARDSAVSGPGCGVGTTRSTAARSPIRLTTCPSAAYQIIGKGKPPPWRRI